MKINTREKKSHTAIDTYSIGTEYCSYMMIFVFFFFFYIIKITTFIIILMSHCTLYKIVADQTFLQSRRRAIRALGKHLYMPGECNQNSNF